MRMATKEDLKPGTILYRDGLEYSVQNENPEGRFEVLVIKDDKCVGLESIKAENVQNYQVKNQSLK